MNRMSNREDWVELKDWEATPDEEFFTYQDGCVYGKYDQWSSGNPSLCIFYIRLHHFNVRMPDIVKHINYFLNFYDYDKEFFMGLLSVKFMVGERQEVMTYKEFKNLIMTRMITDSVVAKVKNMATDLNMIDVDTDSDGKYKAVPKITKEDARLILAVSICIRLVLPLCIHFINISQNYLLPGESKTDGYIRIFDKIFMDIISKFERGERPIYALLCKFAFHRADHNFKADVRTWEQKKQLHGDNQELYLEELVHEVIIVKSLYKYEYHRSIVSFINGVIVQDYYHSVNENFAAKPVLTENTEGSDEDYYLSHAESLEMSSYKMDESSIIIDEVNIRSVMADIRKRFNIRIGTAEMKFYEENVIPNRLSMQLVHDFYSKYFKDTHATDNLGDKEIIRLLIILKKYLSMKGMSVLPQICTAIINGKFRTNTIRNTKFIDKYSKTSIYKSIIEEKFKYVRELGMKEDPVINLLSKFINCTFVLVDYDPLINGITINDTNMMETIIDEYFRFLSII